MLFENCGFLMTFIGLFYDFWPWNGIFSKKLFLMKGVNRLILTWDLHKYKSYIIRKWLFIRQVYVYTQIYTLLMWKGWARS